MGQRISIVDAFTGEAFAGNPAAVCVLSDRVPDAWMQDLAAEMNLSETCYLLQEGEAFSLRWFTPAMEVDLCGHATLAAAHTLWEQSLSPSSSAALFNTRSGRLVAQRRDDLIELDFPAKVSSAVDPPSGLNEGLRVEVINTERNDRDLLVEVADEEAVREHTPDLAWVLSLSSLGMIVTSRSNSAEYDFVSRYFAPRAGIDEDPVCGSAHCCLGPYWAKRLRKTELTGFQASQRGGVVRVRVDEERVKLAGQATTVLHGELTAAAAPRTNAVLK